MNIKTISSFDELNDTLSEYQHPKTNYFRGQSTIDWPLMPKAGRPPFDKVEDEKVFEVWKRQAIQFTEKDLNNDWDWLALAQHHGLATRLLDWTRNPLVAAFFSANSSPSDDGAIYIAEFQKYIVTSKVKPFEYNGVAVFHPNIVAPRLHSQQGLFSCHHAPLIELTEDSKGVVKLDKIIIKSSCKKELISKLNYYGINYLKLFPDLDGLSKYLEWTLKSEDYWNLT